jgi:hypothetical protein
VIRIAGRGDVSHPVSTGDKFAHGRRDENVKKLIASIVAVAFLMTGSIMAANASTMVAKATATPAAAGAHSGHTQTGKPGAKSHKSAKTTKSTKVTKSTKKPRKASKSSKPSNGKQKTKKAGR